MDCRMARTYDNHYTVSGGLSTTARSVRTGIEPCDLHNVYVGFSKLHEAKDVHIQCLELLFTIKQGRLRV